MIKIRTTVGPKGQIVIPIQLREEIGLYPGEKVEFDLKEGVKEITIRKESSPIKLFIEAKRIAGRKFTLEDFKKIDWDKAYEEQLEERWKKASKSRIQSI